MGNPVKDSSLVRLAHQSGIDLTAFDSYSEIEKLAALAPGTRVGGPISVPVGSQSLGRIYNLLGEPIDGKGPLPHPEKRYPIHRTPPSFEDQATETAQLETGIKVVDLLAPYPKGGKIGLFGGAPSDVGVVKPIQ